MKLTDKYCENCGIYVATIRTDWWRRNTSVLYHKVYEASEFYRNGKHFWLCYDCQKKDKEQ